MVFGQRQAESLSSCRYASELRFSHPFHERRTSGELPCEIVGLLQPGNQLRIPGDPSCLLHCVLALGSNPICLCFDACPLLC
jgi:hypothetical protein